MSGISVTKGLKVKKVEQPENCKLCMMVQCSSHCRDRPAWEKWESWKKSQKN